MIEVKTADLIGPALDWAVAEAIGWKEPIFSVGAIRYMKEDKFLMMETPDPDEPDDVTEPHHFNHYDQWSPSRIWSQGGQLILKYTISIDYRRISNTWDAYCDTWVNRCETPLIAACRAIVAAHLGDTVQIPDELAERVGK